MSPCMCRLADHQAIRADLRIVCLYCTIRPARISWLRHILEGYDGLAMLSTVSVEKGFVRIQTPSCSYMDLMLLMESLAPGLSPYPAGV